MTLHKSFGPTTDILADLTKLNENFDALEFHGALVYFSTAPTILTATDTTASWTAVSEDTDGFYSTSAPTRLSVPAGIDRVVLRAQIQWDTSTTGIRNIGMYKDGGFFAGRGVSTVPAGGVAIQNITSAPVSVTSTAYFELVVYHTHSTSLGLGVDNYRSWFSIQSVP